MSIVDFFQAKERFFSTLLRVALGAFAHDTSFLLDSAYAQTVD